MPDAQKEKYKGYPKVAYISGEKYHTYEHYVHNNMFFNVTRKNYGKDILDTFLPVLINEYNELLKLHDYPIIEYVDFLDNKMPVSSLLEKSFIKTAEQSILWKVHQLPGYKYGEYITTICRNIQKIKKEEIEWLNSRLVHKIDNDKLFINIDGNYYS